MGTLITNYHKRELACYEQLPENEQEYYDYAPESSFFKYKGQWYCLADFVRFGSIWQTSQPDDLKKWHAWNVDSFFSAVVIKIDDDALITVGLYLS
jgi:hypothetical protein